MKKTHLIIAGLLVAALVSCNNMGKKSGTSLVTITVGGGGTTASIKAQRATMVAKVLNYIRNRVQVPDAEALIPSNLVSINLTVTASDMPTISSTVNAAGRSSVDIIVEVPNGLNRRFVITGYDSNPNIAYWGSIPADLDGMPVTLPISMINLGSVTGILYVSTGGSDATGDGTEQNPYRTITQALSVSTGTPEAIFVGPGTYDDLTGGETFPLQLNPGTALVCRGANHASVVDSTASSNPVINGNVGASVQFCTVRVCDATGIDDSTGAGSPTQILINNVLLDDLEEVQPGCGPLPAITLGANSTVYNTRIKNSWSDGISITGGNPTISNTVIEDPSSSGISISSGDPVITNSTIVVTGTQSVFPFNGIYTTGGNPTITNTTINGFFGDGVGWAVDLGPGNGSVSQSSMSGNGGGVTASGGNTTIAGNAILNSSSNGGISISGGNSVINGNTIDGGYYGIRLSGVVSAPTATISGNTIKNALFYGIYATAVGASSIHNNSLSCNATADFYLADAGASGFNISLNAWDHDAATPVKGPTISNDTTGCPAGIDICYSSSLTLPPAYSPFNTAVPGGCQ